MPNSMQATRVDSLDLSMTAEQLMFDSMKLSKSDADKIVLRNLKGKQINENPSDISKRRFKFEEELRHHRKSARAYIHYAQFELLIGELARSRSIYERGLNELPSSKNIWDAYINMELELGFINSARNLLLRATTILPLYDSFWLKFISLEQSVSNEAGVRAIYSRWLKYKPLNIAYSNYFTLELKTKGLSSAMKVIDQFIQDRGTSEAYCEAAKWVSSAGSDARATYLRAEEDLSVHNISVEWYVSFAQYLEQSGDSKGAEEIIEKGLSRIMGDDRQTLHDAYLSLKRRIGTVEATYLPILLARIDKYKAQLEQSPTDYDTIISILGCYEEIITRPFDSSSNMTVYTDLRSLVSILFREEKTCLARAKRMMYAAYQLAWMSERYMRDFELTEDIYRKCEVFCDKHGFAFSKLFIEWALHLVRTASIDAGRAKFEDGFSKWPKRKLLVEFIEFEKKLGDADTCRKIAAKFISSYPIDPISWLSLIQIERALGNHEKVIDIYNIAVKQDQMISAHVIWQSYLDYLISRNDLDGARALYERLFETTNAVSALLSLAQFENEVGGSMQRARLVYERAILFCQQTNSNEDRYTVLQTWHQIESSLGNSEMVVKIAEKFPQLIVKRDEKDKEYVDYIWPNTNVNLSKLLAAAEKWKATQE